MLVIDTANILQYVERDDYYSMRCSGPYFIFMIKTMIGLYHACYLACD